MALSVAATNLYLIVLKSCQDTRLPLSHTERLIQHLWKYTAKVEMFCFELGRLTYLYSSDIPPLLTMPVEMAVQVPLA
jgi:hypothetical protein